MTREREKKRHAHKKEEETLDFSQGKSERFVIILSHGAVIISPSFLCLFAHCENYTHTHLHTHDEYFYMYTNMQIWPSEAQHYRCPHVTQVYSCNTTTEL